MCTSIGVNGGSHWRIDRARDKEQAAAMPAARQGECVFLGLANGLGLGCGWPHKHQTWWVRRALPPFERKALGLVFSPLPPESLVCNTEATRFGLVWLFALCAAVWSAGLPSSPVRGSWG